MSRVRGGSNSTQIRVSGKPVSAPVDRIDIFIAFDNQALSHVKHRLDAKTIIIGEKDHINNTISENTFSVAFQDIAKDIGNSVYSNTIAVGLLSCLINIDQETVESQIQSFFKSKKPAIISDNIKSIAEGYKRGSQINNTLQKSFNIEKSDIDKPYLLLNGAQSVGLGALAGGCSFISSYPMSPSTGVLTFLSKHQEKFDVIVEQAEDEISAINMGLGAWFAGARALVTTSGGGFALMTEGLSLAGMIESPMVIHVAQRPGPATGLPTRTEQGDLLMTLYAGHGEFPRIIYAPGTLLQGFQLTKKAFDIADRYQIPVIILTDQAFIDSLSMVEKSALSTSDIEEYIIKTSDDYKRYEITNDGISPRGIPGFGSGFVCVDSDEHDEYGRITEDMRVRNQMNEKRMKKHDLLLNEIVAPTFHGPKEYRNLVLCWGSTFPIIKEAVQMLGRSDIGLLHFSQVYPIHSSIKKYLDKSMKTIMIENNQTGQFARLIKTETGAKIDHRIVQYSGLPFTVETIKKRLKDILEEKP